MTKLKLLRNSPANKHSDNSQIFVFAPLNDDETLADLTGATTIYLKVGVSAGNTINEIMALPATLDADKNVEVEINDAVARVLQPKEYLVEVWAITGGTTAIYPSDDYGKLTITQEITTAYGDIVSSITWNEAIAEVKQQASDATDNLKTGYEESETDLKADYDKTKAELATDYNDTKTNLAADYDDTKATLKTDFDTAKTNLESDVMAELKDPKYKGDTGNQGEQGIQGIQGPTGKGFSIAKTFASVDTLDGTGLTDGDFVMVTDDTNDPDNGRLYSWDGAQFQFINDMSGVQGIQGEQGPQGVTGETGETGKPGADGANGKSAYELAVDAGFTGTEAEWRDSLKGAPGDVSLTVDNVFTGKNTFKTDPVDGNGVSYITSDVLAPNLIDVATDEWQTVPSQSFSIPIILGQIYNFAVEIKGLTTTGALCAIQWAINGTAQSPDLISFTSLNTDSILKKSWTATATGTLTLLVQKNGISKNDNIQFKNFVATRSASYVPYEQARANRSGIDEASQYGAENLILNSANPTGWGGWQFISNGHTDTTHSVTTNTKYRRGYDKVFSMATKYADEVYASSTAFPVIANTVYQYAVLLAQSANVSSVDVYYASNVTAVKLNNDIKVSTTGFSLISGSFTTGANDTSGQLRIDNNGSTDGQIATLQFVEAQISREDTLSPWKPSPKDSVTDNHDGTMMVNGVSYNLADILKRITALEGK